MPHDDTGIILMSEKQAKMHKGGGGGAAVIDSYDTKKSEKFRWRAARVTRPRGDDYVQLKIAVAPSKGLIGCPHLPSARLSAYEKRPLFGWRSCRARL